MGRINTGGAKKRTGDNIALASSVSGTTLKLNPPKGYYDGVTGTVNVTDADFVASKIKNGVNLFGIVGTLSNIYTAGANGLAASLPTYRMSNLAALTKLKEVTINTSGSYRFRIEWRYTLSSQPGELRYYKNGVFLSLIQRATTTYSVFNSNTQDFTVNSGDKIQVYAMQEGADGAGNWEVQNMSVQTQEVNPVTVSLD